jgi:transcriptional regulator with XRE-family HTH domain
MEQVTFERTVANHIYYWRHMRGLNQAELAELTGLKASAISHFECCRRMPSIQNFYKICRALRVKAEKIFPESAEGR